MNDDNLDLFDDFTALAQKFGLSDPINSLVEQTFAGDFKLRAHPPEQCEGNFCGLHNPSDHHMNEWAYYWNGSLIRLERNCPLHNVSHPDPDDMAYKSTVEDNVNDTHNCCGCCNENFYELAQLMLGETSCAPN